MKSAFVHRTFACLAACACIAPLVLAAAPGSEATGLTHHRSDGNRVLDGRGALPDTVPVDVALGKPVRWVVGVPSGQQSLWVASFDDGSLEALMFHQGAIQRIPDFEPARVAGPPILVREGSKFTVPAPGTPGSALSHPVPVRGRPGIAYISARGRFTLSRPPGSPSTGLEFSVPMDARVLADEDGRLLVLSDPTGRYPHGALGDTEEAASMTLVDTSGGPRIQRRISFPEPFVFEGIAPIWVDWNGDGEREIVATLSSPSGGARIVLFAENGDRLAESASIGTGNRWRHAIAVAAFGPAGEAELAEVVTPHLGRVLQFLRWRGSRLEPVAAIRGFTSHVYGSRNLDLAVAGDFDADGRVELLLPDPGMRSLGGIRRTAAGAEVAWTLSLPSALTSNIGGVVMEDGSMIVAVGLENGTLRIWGAPASK